MARLNDTFQAGKDLVEIARLGLCAGICIASFPIYLTAASLDIRDELNYINSPDNINYNPYRPTPNSADFPKGNPGFKRTKSYRDFMLKLIKGDE